MEGLRSELVVKSQSKCGSFMAEMALMFVYTIAVEGLFFIILIRSV